MKTYVLNKTDQNPDFKTDYKNELNTEQLKVVLKGDGPCLVLAGAGSGKTRTIVYRVAYLLEQGVQPEQILLLTFTNKAAREMRERVESLVAGGPPSPRLRGTHSLSQMWGGTFHHVCHRILRESAEAAGLRPGFTILDSEDARDLMKVCIRECQIDPGSGSGAGPARRFPSAAVLLNIASYARNARMAVKDVLEFKYPNFLELVPDIVQVTERYDIKKRESNSVDFDDLLLLVQRLLLKDERARKKYAQRFKYILVDEYQDTNHIQAEIVRLLASEHGNVLIVGDDAQSIYSFRGADIKNILSFPDVFPGAKTYRLETNYRSTPEVLDVANDVISRNANQFKKELKSMKPSFAKPQVVTAVTAAQEAEFIAQRVLELRDEGIPLREIAVLFRATFHSQALEFELMKRDIPYEYRGGKKFFDRAHVKDVLAFLKILANKEDLVAWMRTLSLQVGIGSVSAGKIYERVRGGGLEDVNEATIDGLGTRVQKGWTDFLSIFRAMRRADEVPSLIVHSIVGSDYAKYLESQYPNYRDRLEDLRELANFAGRYEEISAFLADISLQEDIAHGGKQNVRFKDTEDRMILTTIHQAKGLEWDAVFVLHMTQGQFPNRRALLEDGGMEEERRLFYVAVTRARRDLVLCHPVAVGYDNMDFESKSEFLDELSLHLVDEVAIEESYDDLPTIDLDEDVGPPKTSFLKDISEY